MVVGHAVDYSGSSQAPNCKLADVVDSSQLVGVSVD